MRTGDVLAPGPVPLLWALTVWAGFTPFGSSVHRQAKSARPFRCTAPGTIVDARWRLPPLEVYIHQVMVGNNGSAEMGHSVYIKERTKITTKKI